MFRVRNNCTRKASRQCERGSKLLFVSSVQRPCVPLSRLLAFSWFLHVGRPRGLLKNDAPKSAEADAATETTIAPVAIERLATPSREGASIVLGKIAGKKVAFIADEDTGTVRTIDLAEKREVGSVVLGGRPGQLLVMKEGQLAVALRDDSSVALIDAHADGTLVLGKKTSTASEPIALALSPDDATLYVATGFSHALEAFHVNAGAEDGALGEHRSTFKSDANRVRFRSRRTESARSSRTRRRARSRSSTSATRKSPPPISEFRPHRSAAIHSA